MFDYKTHLYFFEKTHDEIGKTFYDFVTIFSKNSCPHLKIHDPDDWQFKFSETILPHMQNLINDNRSIDRKWRKRIYNYANGKYSTENDFKQWISRIIFRYQDKHKDRILWSVPESESHFSKNMIGVFKDKFCGLANNDLVKITRFSDQTQHQQNDYESSGSIFGQQIKLFERSD